MLFQRLSARPHGFGDLRRALPGVSPRVLRAQLRQMAADGLVERQPRVPASAGICFTLTPYGRTLGPVFETLWRWGVGHLASPDTARGTRVVPPRAVVSDQHGA